MAYMDYMDLAVRCPRCVNDCFMNFMLKMCSLDSYFLVWLNKINIDSLMQKRRNSSAPAVELRLFCIKPSIFGCLHLRQWPVTYLMTLPNWTVSCQPGPPRARYGQ